MKPFAFLLRQSPFFLFFFLPQLYANQLGREIEGVKFSHRIYSLNTKVYFGLIYTDAASKYKVPILLQVEFCTQIHVQVMNNTFIYLSQEFLFQWHSGNGFSSLSWDSVINVVSIRNVNICWVYDFFIMYYLMSFCNLTFLYFSYICRKYGIVGIFIISIPAAQP